jgi:transcriptional regulator with XRE-family HTH domain
MCEPGIHPYLNAFHRQHSDRLRQHLARQPQASLEDAMQQYDRIKRRSAQGRPPTIAQRETGACAFMETMNKPNQKTQKRTSDALAIMHRLTGSSPATAALIEQERSNLDLARKIYELRTRAKLSQAELAKRIGATQSVVSRIEDANYEELSLAMLRRIASAFEQRVEIRFVATSPPTCGLRPVRRYGRIKRGGARQNSTEADRIGSSIAGRPERRVR